MPKKELDTTLRIVPLHQAEIKLRIIGTTALYQNRMANKAKQQLLVGGQKKSKADRAVIKHDPEQEFRDSAEILPAGPTVLGLRVVAVKAAMCTAALETAGLTKTGAQRLLFMPGEHFPLYGVPYLKMDICRMADQNRTPDVRTRCFLPRWGVEVGITFVTPQLSAQSVATLLQNAGLLVGVGDYRQEKGKGSYGSFRVIDQHTKDKEWDALVKDGDRKAQLKAMEDPDYADKDTEDLMDYFYSEVKRRAAA